VKESNSPHPEAPYQDSIEKTFHSMMHSTRPHPKAKKNGLWFGVFAVVFSSLLVNLFIFLQH
jgi:hypothetical protein